MEILGLHGIYKLAYKNSFWKGSQAPVQPPTQNRVSTEFIPVFSGHYLDLEKSAKIWPDGETNSLPTPSIK